MASKYQAESGPQSNPTGPHEDISESGRANQNEESTEQRNPEDRSQSPAYIAPIPSIPSIPPVPSGIQICTGNRPELMPSIGRLLVGNPINQDGDIVSEETGQVLARAAGDLPSMVGRRVSNSRGDILGDNGELLGYIDDVIKTTPGRLRSLFDVVGHASSSLMVDDMGNILDSTGTVVGHFHDNNNPLHHNENGGMDVGWQTESTTTSSGPTVDGQGQPSPPQQSRSRSPTPGGQSAPKRTESQRKENAESWRKENPTDSPSDIFLDVKSTREGVQLTIRIPTVFPGQQATPHISFS
ncbi:hypothetical protein C8A05DRAFT_13588 [Staphylotrichum tortipilum]|uniref:Uncharacterized protein n=1 Tax=Staphylotrichum tortipilum TaxID=2831512 RepID=A0AAN6MQE0_9PEZI|nr:hypothetical protein C8A05DRAFT_13588 [Staphylotrichum longicolle]